MPRERKPNDNLKYLTRCHYFGKLVDWEYVNESMVLKLLVYTATQYYGNSTYIRIYVPDNYERHLADKLITGDNYFVVASPYRVHFNKKYPYRVDLLLDIFKQL